MWTVQIVEEKIEITHDTGITLRMSEKWNDFKDYRDALALCSHLNDSNAMPVSVDLIPGRGVSLAEAYKLWENLGNGRKNTTPGNR